jgi:hypothetical protein
MQIPSLRIVGAGARVPEPKEFDETVLGVWRDNDDGTIFAWAQSNGGERWMHLRGVASYGFRPGDGDVTAIPDPSAGTERVLDGYQRTVLPMALQLGGREVLHASAVLTAGEVVAFCAVSETGKSTFAREFALRGYAVCADDALAFHVEDGSVTALPLPFQLPLRPRSSPQRNVTAEAVEDLPTPEASAPLRAVCVLERTQPPGSGDAVQLRQLSPPQAFPAVLAHAYCYSLDDVERNRQMIANYLDLCGRSPIYRVAFRAGLDHLPAILDAIEEAVGMMPRRSR